MMRILLFSWLCIAALPALAGAQERAIEATQLMVAPLRSAPFFAMGGVGFNGGRSSGEKALRDLASSQGAAAVFEATLLDRRASSAGQLYALLGLSWTNRARFEALVTPFLSEKSLVKIRSGCIVLSISVSAIAERIQRGNYPRPGGTNPYAPVPAPSSRLRAPQLFGTQAFGGLQLRPARPYEKMALARLLSQS